MAVDREEFVETLAKSVHDYWHERRQVTPTWEESGQIYQHFAREAALEWSAPLWQLLEKQDAEFRARLEDLAFYWENRGWVAGAAHLRQVVSGGPLEWMKP